MQLGRIHIAGLGRLSDASMKVRGKVTAVVGPNEAGESTLLRALASISNGEAFTDAPGGDVPRRTTPADDAPAATVYFALDADDYEAIGVIASETYGGGVTRKLEPIPRRPRSHRQPAADAASITIDRLREASSSAGEEAQAEA